MSSPEEFDLFFSPRLHIECFSWRSFGRPHKASLFPIKKPFCRGSSGSHASKYIHFHRKCFVLEVQCFLGLLCSHSAQVGFLSAPMCAVDPDPSTAPLHMPHNGEHKQNLSPSRSSPAQYGHVLGSGGKKRLNKGALHYSAEKLSVRACAFASLHMLQASKQTRHGEAQTNRETCNKSEIVWEGYDRCL